MPYSKEECQQKIEIQTHILQSLAEILADVLSNAKWCMEPTSSIVIDGIIADLKVRINYAFDMRRKACLELEEVI